MEKRDIIFYLILFYTIQFIQQRNTKVNLFASNKIIKNISRIGIFVCNFIRRSLF